MTTRIVIMNEGPEYVRVDTPSKVIVLKKGQSTEQYVYPSSDITITELKDFDKLKIKENEL